jgi:hypothetical protein
MFPEFTATNTQRPELVEETLTYAAQHVSAVRWGARYERGVYLKLAHMLSLSPYGESARLTKKTAETVYSAQFDDELRALPVRMMGL